jgi:hypothetical protein
MKLVLLNKLLASLCLLPRNIFCLSCRYSLSQINRRKNRGKQRKLSQPFELVKPVFTYSINDLKWITILHRKFCKESEFDQEKLKFTMMKMLNHNIYRLQSP